MREEETVLQKRKGKESEGGVVFMYEVQTSGSQWFCPKAKAAAAAKGAAHVMLGLFIGGPPSAGIVAAAEADNCDSV